mmetsp:Transcript_29041/g.98867  ORF Transcript_29041/g.98867 Transcript_29041/m.98867 type:complete len:212 (-) Transcript_29041:612-1247(-)
MAASTSLTSPWKGAASASGHHRRSAAASRARARVLFHQGTFSGAGMRVRRGGRKGTSFFSLRFCFLFLATTSNAACATRPASSGSRSSSSLTAAPTMFHVAADTVWAAGCCSAGSSMASLFRSSALAAAAARSRAASFSAELSSMVPSGKASVSRFSQRKLTPRSSTAAACARRAASSSSPSRSTLILPSSMARPDCWSSCLSRISAAEGM